MAGDEPYRMSPTEIAQGYLLGFEGESEPAAPEAPTDPRHALEQVVRRSLERAPCAVAFSGGRDSSAVLAVAVHVARTEGLPEPVPVTRVFPGVTRAEETEWQELVVRHLGLREWNRVTITDELDLLGPLATDVLERYGVLWPPTIHGDGPLTAQVRGGSVIDGEGGDEVLGVGGHRVAPLTRLVRRPRPLRWHRVRSALATMAPAPVRRERLARQARAVGLEWLQPEARAAFVAEYARTAAAGPLSYAASVRLVPRRRSQRMLARNRRMLARRDDVEFTSPLLHPDFVRALAAQAGWLGHTTRADALRALVGDLLPSALVERTSKAIFNDAFAARHTRAFIGTWTGEGVDRELVDPEALRRIWAEGSVPAPTAALLQQAWLGTRRGLDNTARARGDTDSA